MKTAEKLVCGALALGAAGGAVCASAIRPRLHGPDWGVLREHRYAHRGLHNIDEGVPENSLAAFRRAIMRGFGAELDVHLLADGTLAVFHDSELRRMTGRDGVIEDLTETELDACRLAGTEEHIPTFAQVLALFEGTGLPLVVELKSYRGNHDALTERTVALLDRFRVPYCIESFDPRCLIWLRKHRPEIVRGQLARDFIRKSAGMKRPLEYMSTELLFNAAVRPDFIAYNFDDRGRLGLRLCRRLYGVQVFYWTIRSREAMEEAEREGACVIFERFVP